MGKEIKVTDRIDDIMTHIIDIKTQVAVNQQQLIDINKNISACPVSEIDKRLQTIEDNSRWYKRIYTAVAGAVGALVVVIFEWALHRSK